MEDQSSIITINVGGKIYKTRYSTIEKFPESNLKKIIDKNIVKI